MHLPRDMRGRGRGDVLGKTHQTTAPSVRTILKWCISRTWMRISSNASMDAGDICSSSRRGSTRRVRLQSRA